MRELCVSFHQPKEIRSAVLSYSKGGRISAAIPQVAIWGDHRVICDLPPSAIGRSPPCLALRSPFPFERSPLGRSYESCQSSASRNDGCVLGTSGIQKTVVPIISARHCFPTCGHRSDWFHWFHSWRSTACIWFLDWFRTYSIRANIKPCAAQWP